MHYLMLATLERPRMAASQDTRERIRDVLINDDSFCGEGGRFGCPLADWFVIGGRWSGALTRALLDPKQIEKVDAEFERRHGWWIGGKDGVTDADRREQYAKIFRKAFPDFTGVIPAWRDQYRNEGYEDDAMLVTEAIYDRSLKPYAGLHDSEEFCDFEFDDASPAYVGKKWIVVVDYHS